MPRKSHAKITMEDIVAECQSLRATFERDEAKFFLGLVRIEREHMHLLEQNGCATFAQFLRSYSLCEVFRYAAFVKGLEHVTEQEALSIGAPSVMALAKVVDSTRVPEFVKAVELFKESHGGCVPRSETPRKLLRQVDPRRETPRVILEADARSRHIEQLLLENRQLRSELAAAQKRNRELERELQKQRSRKKAA